MKNNLKFNLNADLASWSVTDIGSYKDADIVIPAEYNGKPVTSIGDGAFYGCHLFSPVARYKAFNLDSVEGGLYCRDCTFEENKWSDTIENICICESGYHYCTNLFDIFNYYSGVIDKDIAIYGCEVGNQVLTHSVDSKCCTNRIKPVKRLYREDVIRILNGASKGE